jgi:serine/threonine protein kinase
VDRALLDSKIMLPLDILTDDRFLYSVMPYCDGGELFDRLDQTDKFTEGQARYWMHQIIMVRFYFNISIYTYYIK